MDTLTVEQVDGQLLKLIDSATKNLKQFRVTSQEGTVIILPEETYDNLIVTLELLSTPGLMETICNGSVTSRQDFLNHT